jgi:Na+-translocating ferredoxin:NAD+ oxidoreductase subunit C
MAECRTFPRGGIVAQDGKDFTLGRPIANASIPPVAILPLRQHLGIPAVCVVSVGQVVKEGALIGIPTEAGAAAVHSPIPGTVSAIGDITLTDGSGCPAVTIELGGEFELSGRPLPMRPWRKMQKNELLEQVRLMGVVGMGGKGIPLHYKYRSHAAHRVESLLINAMDGDPYLSADLQLLQEKPQELAEGILIAVRILDPVRVIVAVGERSVAAGEAVAAVLRDQGGKAAVEPLQDRYPQGEERLLASTILGLETPQAVALREKGIVISCVATILALYEAVVLGKPSIDRVLTVSGPGVGSLRNLKVRFGTPFRDLLAECGGLPQPRGRLVVGGPLRGHTLAAIEAPVTKLTTGAVSIPRRLAWNGREDPCIRCGRCEDVCPYGLAPHRLHKLAEAGLTTALVREGAGECVECGCCAYVCPSRIPLLGALRAGKRAIGAPYGR